MSRTPHDKTFHQLMEERSFFLPFLKTYLPPEIQAKINWDSVRFYRASGKHISGQKQRAHQSDIMYLADFMGEPGIIWLHGEHQSTPDPLLGLRIMQYQISELLNYAKANKSKKLPTIVTLIYYQGTKPYPYETTLASYFANPVQGLKYLGHPILIDLPNTPDSELAKHTPIAGVELLLKHIRHKNIEPHLPTIFEKLKKTDPSLFKIVLEYLILSSDASQHRLENIVRNTLPDYEEDVMTLAKRLKQEGQQQGLRQGILQTAKNLLLKNLPVTLIAETTGLTLGELQHLQQDMPR